MSERYSNTFEGVYDSVERKSLFASEAAAELNRLTAEAATLRELLHECQPTIWDVEDNDLSKRIEAALQESGDEAARPDAEE